MIKNILFVCTGNICRSPMAEGLFKKLVISDDIHISSAGIQDLGCQNPSLYAIEACKKYDVDISHYTSDKLTQEIVDKNDLILCMTLSHKEIITSLFPSSKDKVFLLKEYVHPNITENIDIKDPYGYSLDVYKACCAEIYECLEILNKKLK